MGLCFCDNLSVLCTEIYPILLGLKYIQKLSLFVSNASNLGIHPLKLKDPLLSVSHLIALHSIKWQEIMPILPQIIVHHHHMGLIIIGWVLYTL